MGTHLNDIETPIVEEADLPPHIAEKGKTTWSRNLTLAHHPAHAPPLPHRLRNLPPCKKYWNGFDPRPEHLRLSRKQARLKASPTPSKRGFILYKPGNTSATTAANPTPHNAISALCPCVYYLPTTEIKKLETNPMHNIAFTFEDINNIVSLDFAHSHFTIGDAVFVQKDGCPID
eukprot:g69284.t1